MTKKQVQHTAKLALRAAYKFREAAINAEANYKTYFKEEYSCVAAGNLRSFAELMPLLAADLLVKSSDYLNKDVPK